MDTPPRDRSLFGPIVLIGAGVIWLLANFNLIADLSWPSLARLWPLLLIAAGLDMLFGRRHPLVGALIGLLTVGAAAALLVAGPRLGLAPTTPDLRTERFTEPLEGASAAEVTLDLAEFPTTVSALAGGDALIDADLTHDGHVAFSATGGAQRLVRLDYNSGIRVGLVWPDFSAPLGEWRIGLSPEVPLELVVDSGSGSVDFDLAELNLTALDIDGGSGSVRLTLPIARDEPYDVRLDGGSGSQTVQVPVSAAGTFTYDGGSGSLRLNVAPTAAVRLEVRDNGSGSVRVPDGWEQVEDGDDDEGAWQSATYADSEGQALLVVVEELGSGSVTVSEE